jgi:hypothetical protein
LSKKAELCIRIGFNADLGPAFYLNADPDPESYTCAVPVDPDLDPGPTSRAQKVEFLHKMYT